MGFGSAIAGAFGAAGSAASSAMAYYESREARKFAKEMRKTAYQTTVRDMRKAGLNPILAARIGPTPMPGVPQAPQFGNAALSGMEAAGSAAGIHLKGEQAESEGATRWLKAAQQQLAAAQVSQVEATTAKEASQTKLNEVAAARQALEARILGYSEEAARVRGELDASEVGRALHMIGRGAEAAGPLGAGLLGGVLGASSRMRKMNKKPKGSQHRKRDKHRPTIDTSEGNFDYRDLGTKARGVPGLHFNERYRRR